MRPVRAGLCRAVARAPIFRGGGPSVASACCGTNFFAHCRQRRLKPRSILLTTVGKPQCGHTQYIGAMASPPRPDPVSTRREPLNAVRKRLPSAANPPSTDGDVELMPSTLVAAAQFLALLVRAWAIQTASAASPRRDYGRAQVLPDGTEHDQTVQLRPRPLIPR